MRNFESYFLGRVPYRAALSLQEQLVAKVSSTGLAQIIGLEHPSVITLGRRSEMERDLRTPVEELEHLDVIKTDRGGEATLHNPGQLIIYPILPLPQWGLEVRDYVKLLVEVTQSTLMSFGVRSFERSSSEPGLYTSRGKIAFFGIRVSRGVTSHGISLNVSNDLSEFRHIVSCGRQNERFDHLAHYDINIAISEMYDHWITQFKSSLGIRKSPEWVSGLESNYST